MKSNFKINDMVYHHVFGKGKIIKIHNNYVDVKFEILSTFRIIRLDYIKLIDKE